MPIRCSSCSRSIVSRSWSVRSRAPSGSSSMSRRGSGASAGERDALLLAARERGHRAVIEPVEVDEGEHLLDCGPALLPSTGLACAGRTRRCRRRPCAGTARSPGTSARTAGGARARPRGRCHPRRSFPTATVRDRRSHGATSTSPSRSARARPSARRRRRSSRRHRGPRGRRSARLRAPRRALRTPRGRPGERVRTRARTARSAP